jgi:hypothetical protein
MPNPRESYSAEDEVGAELDHIWPAPGTAPESYAW